MIIKTRVANEVREFDAAPIARDVYQVYNFYLDENENLVRIHLFFKSSMMTFSFTLE